MKNFYDTDDIRSNPTARICEEEYKQAFISFCSLMCLIHNKKLNLANIFLLLLKHEKIMDLYKEVCQVDHDYEGLKMFLDYDNTLHKSKYIKKYLNLHHNNKKTRFHKSY